MQMCVEFVGAADDAKELIPLRFVCGCAEKRQWLTPAWKAFDLCETFHSAFVQPQGSRSV